MSFAKRAVAPFCSKQISFRTMFMTLIQATKFIRRYGSIAKYNFISSIFELVFNNFNQAIFKKVLHQTSQMSKYPANSVLYLYFIYFLKTLNFQQTSFSALLFIETHSQKKDFWRITKWEFIYKLHRPIQKNLSKHFDWNSIT